MKILFVTPGCFDKGGISRYSRYQIQALKDIFGTQDVKELSLLGPDAESFETNFRVYWHGKGNTAQDKIKFALKWITLALAWRPQVIHVAHVNFSGLAVLIAKLIGAKTVLNVYGLEVWSGLSRDAAWGLENVDHVISDCHFTANYLEENQIRPKRSTTIIWDCVDLDIFNPLPNQWKYIQEKYQLPNREEHFIVLSLGRLAFEAAHKGYDRLIAVFKKLVDQYPSARLIIAGKGNMRTHLQESTIKLGIAEKVTFTGMIPDADLAALYSYAHVFSLVSDQGKGRGEGIPLTPLEAMACKVPIIVGNQDGSQEAISQNANGIAINPFDLEAHQAFFEKLILNPATQENMAKKSYILARKVFDYASFKVKHQQFYKDIDFG